MSEAYSISTRSRYGLERVCRCLRVPRSSFYAIRAGERTARAAGRIPPRRRGPQGPCSDAELAAAIRRAIEQSPFHGEGYRKIWAKLRLDGLRTSKERVRRVMREHGLQAPHRVGKPRGPRVHDGTITTDLPDQMWGTDQTATLTGEGQAFVFIAVDHCTAELMGVHASARGDRFEALEPIRQGVRTSFGGYGETIATGLRLRHDHGSCYTAGDFQREIHFLGFESSPSFVRAPEGNGCAERIIRTLKENLLWVRSFATIEELRQGLLAWMETYNNEWMIERHGYRSPSQVRRDLAQGLASAA